MGTVKSTGEPKTYRITKSKQDKILKHVNTNHERPAGDVTDWHDLIDKDVIERITQSLGNIIKNPVEYDRVKERLGRQIKLVVLDSGVFPKEILEGFSEQVGDDRTKPIEIHPQSWNMNMILEGTRYVTPGRKNYNNSTVFKDLDKIIEQKSLF